MKYALTGAALLSVSTALATPATIDPASYWLDQTAALTTLQPTGAADGALTPSVGAAFSFSLSPPGVGTVADFANSTPGWVATGPTGAALDNGIPGVGAGTTGTIFRFTGNISLKAGDVITMEHDDGVILKLGGGLAINNPSFTSPTTDTYTMQVSGNFPFEVWYGECCTLPVALEWDVNGSPVTNVPEPAGMAVLGVGLLGLGMVRRRA